VTARELDYDRGSLTVPTGWHAQLDVDPFAVLIVPDGPRDGFVANLNIVRELADGTTADLAGHLAAMAGSLDDHHLIDREDRPVAGGAGGVRLVSLHTTGGEGLVTEQWATADSASRSILSATCLATEYDAHADVFAQIAASWRTHDVEAR
jgi:hypothetical protein